MIALASDELHLWRLPIGDPLPPSRGILDAKEEARAMRFARFEDATRFRFVRANLRCLLGHYLAIAPRSIALGATPDGKPYVASNNPATVTFNVSHCDTMALIVVGRQAILGIDVEDRTRRDDLGEIVASVFDESERAEIELMPEPLRGEGILRGWTRKEALAKAIGSGFLVDPRLFRVPLSAAGRWRVELPGMPSIDLVDISDNDVFAALAATRIVAAPEPRPLLELVSAVQQSVRCNRQYG